MASRLDDEKVWHLQHCPLFAGVSKEELADLRHATVMVKLASQERLMTAQEGMHSIWMIKEGLVSLTYGDAEGKDATVLMLGPGDLFGALEDIEMRDYGENVVALRPTVLCRMTQKQMEVLLNRYPEIAYRVTKFSWRRIARLQQRLAEIMTKSVRERLATLLLKTAADYGANTPEGRRSLGLTITHDELARLVGSSREMVSKVIAQFRDSGWVHSARRTIELDDIEALQRIADAGD